jgi:hypothetical protein
MAVLPSPLAAVGVVSSDRASRTLTVRLSDLEQGFPRLCWREAYRALRRSEEFGWRTADPTVWAGTDSADKVASAVAGEADFGGMLRFAFQPGEPAYQQLVSKPKLTAIVLLDRSSHRFLGVKFRNSRQG